MAVSQKRKDYLKKWRLRNLEHNREKARKWQREWRAKNPEEARIKDSLHHKKRKEKEREYQRNYKKKIDPIKLAARTILNNAIILGKTIRPKICSTCPNTKPQAHHPDYNRPLEVIWLCSKCHALTHHPIKKP